MYGIWDMMLLICGMNDGKAIGIDNLDNLNHSHTYKLLPFKAMAPKNN